MATRSRGTILAFGPGRWVFDSFAGSPRYHLWSLAQRGWEIVFTDPPTRFRNHTEWESHTSLPFHSLRPGRIPPFAPRYTFTEKLSDTWRALVARRLATTALAECQHRNIRPDICWLGAPWHGEILGYLPQGVRTIYHVYDELPESPAFSPSQRGRMARWEGELIQNCDLVACSSRPQLDRRSSLAGHAFLLQNAVDPRFLNPDQLPLSETGQRQVQEIQALPRPRFLYGGVADHRLDPACFQELIRAMGEGSLIIAGLRDRSLDKVLAGVFASHPRIHTTGTVVYTDFPHLYREADCLLLGHRRSPFTDAMYPEKINEYLASGLPIASVALPEVERLRGEATHADAIRTAKTPAEFARACLDAAGDTNPDARQARINLASQHTWDVEADKLEGMLEELVK